MKYSTIVFALLLVFGQHASAQRHKIGTVNAETPEGALLQQIGQESDEAKKISLLEDFAAKFPKHEGAGWVFAQLQPLYVKTKQNDKALEIGEKLVALDPDDVDAAHQNLKAAEARKEPDLIRKWSDATSKAAVKMAGAPQPKEADEVEAWKRDVDYARQVNIYTEYSLYAAAAQTTDPRKRVELVEALEQRNPKSEYLPKMYPLQFGAYRQAGDTAKAFALAEKLLGAGLQDEDMLAFVADQYVQQKKDPEKIVEYANRLVEVVSGKAKPEGASDDDWNKKKTMLAGLGNFMAGSTLVDPLKRYAPADKSLRAALPLVESNDQLKAATLFYLGLANYNLKNLADALKFNQQCAAIKSPFQAKANENIRVLRTQVPAAKKK